MAWNRIQAARLLSEKEMELFEGSLGDRAPRMSDKELGGQIRRVRAQRDKFQDLLRRQRVSTRERTGTKSGASGAANARTEQKVQVFTEALGRLEKQQELRERGGSRTAARKASEGRGSRSTERAAAGTTVRAAVRSALRAKSGGAASGRPRASGGAKAPSRGPSRRRGGPSAASQGGPEMPNAKRAQEMGQDRALAHVSSRGRRQQARRDTR